MRARVCTNCGGPIAGPARRGRCEACYRYLRRRGRDRDPSRPLEEGLRRNRRQLEEEIWGEMVRTLFTDAEARLEREQRRSRPVEGPESPAGARPGPSP
ncbi:MAG TPA: hypothetical protein VNO79_02485 [Actinomycetota bacterium]|nr:hypothetical protein [Actinomycetota bacterium]